MEPPSRAEGALARAGGGPGTQFKRCPGCRELFPFDFRVCPKDGSALEVHLDSEEEDDPLIGELIAGAFCIVGVLGDGGMARVYEAEHARLPKRFAVKVLAPELARNPEATGRFEREAQAVARIIHPHVLDVVDVVRASDGRPCLITELLQGEELGALLGRVRKLSVLPAIEICRQACRGLAAAHERGVIHRDLKPENLFLCPREAGGFHVKILDFGVAKMIDGANLTRVGTVVGTPAYMAPEQARGMPDVDARADVYAVGAVLYHLVTGASPFEDPEPTNILLKVVNDEPRPMRSIDPALPQELERVVVRAMAKSPAHRIASAAELERELGELAKWLEAAAHATTAHHSETLPDARSTVGPAHVNAPPSWSLRHARPLAVSAAIGVTFIAGSAALTLTAIVLRAVSSSSRMSGTSKFVLVLIAGVAAVGALIPTLKAIDARWRDDSQLARLGVRLGTIAVGAATIAGVFALISAAVTALSR